MEFLELRVLDYTFVMVMLVAIYGILMVMCM